ncbi:MAG: FHA domain-containing protein [Chloroflexota bacterium]
MVQIPLFHRHAHPELDEEPLNAHLHVEDRRVYPMQLVLKFVDTGYLISVQLSDCLLVGRDSDPMPDIDLSEIDGMKYGISRMHAAFLYDGRRLAIEDLNSRNGTRINGFQIDGGKPYPLHNGDELEIGHLRVIVQLVRAHG